MSLKKKKYRMIFLAVLLVLFATVLVGSNLWVTQSTKDAVYDDPSLIPENQVGMLLGTSRYLANGRENLYFSRRIDATVALYKAGKIRKILASGANPTEDENEPEEMRDALMEQGIPEEVIHLDYAGLRTLDSVVRTKKVFQTEDVTIISNRFHLTRALFIANRYDMNAIAFASRPLRATHSAKTHVREYLARVKAVLDLYIFNKQPRHLGDPILLTSAFVKRR